MRLFTALALMAVPLLAMVPARAMEVQPATQWSERVFEQGTRFADTVFDGHPALSVEADGAGTMKGGRLDVDLRARPMVDLLWAATSTLGGNDERSQAGDDYVARVMFNLLDEDGRRGGISYVWSTATPVGTWIDSPFSGSRNLVVQTGPARSTGFSRVTRDLLADARAGLGMRNPRLASPAIMSDTDQTGASTRAWYGRIRFEPPSAPPRPADDGVPTS
ncbi:DUF3047 domain-containing protein [Niveispirillum fermenti]|uniref:DUF3047 domain-containing protein n=1 Tax=Niveispirillum fermenti TaxID=1233113 RepID=UPI003A8B484D